MKIVLVIPARFGSTRFPGKPLQLIAGKSLLARVWSVVQCVKGIDQVVVATEEQRIADHARGFGASVVMTSSSCRNGTERTWQALEELQSDFNVAINVQGDSVLTPPWVIQSLVDAFRDQPNLGMATCAMACTPESLQTLERIKMQDPTRGTTVVIGTRGQALYFSKTILPPTILPPAILPPKAFPLSVDPAETPATNLSPTTSASTNFPPSLLQKHTVFRHIGLYGYSREVLSTLAQLEPTPLEIAEGLEQLRALEHGIPIQVIEVNYCGRSHASIDTPADLLEAEKIIAREGELEATFPSNQNPHP